MLIPQNQYATSSRQGKPYKIRFVDLVHSSCSRSHRERGTWNFMRCSSSSLEAEYESTATSCSFSPRHVQIHPMNLLRAPPHSWFKLWRPPPRPITDHLFSFPVLHPIARVPWFPSVVVVPEQTRVLAELTTTSENEAHPNVASPSSFNMVTSGTRFNSTSTGFATVSVNYTLNLEAAASNQICLSILTVLSGNIRCRTKQTYFKLWTTCQTSFSTCAYYHAPYTKSPICGGSNSRASSCAMEKCKRYKKSWCWTSDQRKKLSVRTK